MKKTSLFYLINSNEYDLFFSFLKMRIVKHKGKFYLSSSDSHRWIKDSIQQIIVVDRKLCFYYPLRLVATIFHRTKMTLRPGEFVLKMFLTLNLEPLAACFKTGKCTLNSKWYFKIIRNEIQSVAQHNSAILLWLKAQHI